MPLRFWARRSLCLLLLAVLLGLNLPAVWANQVTFQVNLGAQRVLGNFKPAAGDTVVVAGTFSATDWTTTATLTAGVADPDLYTGTFNNNVASGSSESHKFVINPGGNSAAGQLVWESRANRSFQVTAANQTLPAVYFDDITNVPATAAGGFMAGADFSLLPFFEARGVTYKDNGVTQDGLAILKSHGLNCVRLRLFTSSAAQAAADPYNYTNNLAYTVPLAVRVKNAGLQFMLDFHYSDTWADPAHQTMPNDWTNLTFAELVPVMRAYNSNCLAAFQAAGALPDYVQVGNEITGGMLWPLGAVPGTNAAIQWSQLGQLLTAAIQGIRDVAGTNMPQIVVHIDRGGDWATTKWFFDNLIQTQHVAVDIIGQSYYPFWHGTFDDLANCLTNAALRYGKPVMVAETAFPWTNSVWTTNLNGLPGTTNGQVQYVVALAELVKRVPNGLGRGIFWWGTEYQKASGVNTAGFNTTSFFNNKGNVLPAASVYGQMVAPLWLNSSRQGASLQIQWPLSGAGLSLTTTTSLSPSAVWLNVTNPVQMTDAVYNATLPMTTNAARFYRLQSN